MDGQTEGQADGRTDEAGGGRVHATKVLPFLVAFLVGWSVGPLFTFSAFFRFLSIWLLPR